MTIQVFPGTIVGRIESSNATYLTARAGSNLTATVPDTAFYSGRFLFGGSYFIEELFISFNTKLLGAGALPTSATLTATCSENGSDVDFISSAYEFDWGASLTTADYIPGASLSGLTLAAANSTTGMPAVPTTLTYNLGSFSTGAGIKTTDETRIMITSGNVGSTSAPGGFEYIKLNAASLSVNYADAPIALAQSVML